MALKHKQLEAMKYMLKGLNCAEIAPLVGMERSSVWRWTQSEEWKKTYEEMQLEIKTKGEQMICGDLDTYVAELKSLALTSESEKIRLDSLTYLVDRVMGKSTTKIESTTDTKDNKDDFVDLNNLITDVTDDTDKVISITSKSIKKATETKAKTTKKPTKKVAK